MKLITDVKKKINKATKNKEKPKSTLTHTKSSATTLSIL